MPSGCKKGYIQRKGYHRKAYTRSDGINVNATYVGPSCIKDRGEKGKGLKLIPKLERGELTQFGYSLSDRLVGDRRKPLKKAISKYGALSIMRKLNAVSTLLKNTSPTKSQRAKADSKWISKTYLD